MRTRVRLVEPFGSTFSVAPHALEAQYVWPFRDKATMQLQYPASGVNSGLLSSECEAVFERWDGSTWVEPTDSRYRLDGSDMDRLDRTQTRRYDFIALLPYMLENAYVWEPAGLPTDSDGRALFSAASPGRILRTLFLNAQSRGWGEGLSVDFTDTKDSAGKAWASSINLPVELDQSLYSILDQLGKQGVVDWAGQGRTLRVFNPDTTLGRDLTAGNTPVRLAAISGETAAPQQVSYRDRATVLRVVGDDGKKWDRTAPPSPWGRIEAMMGAGGISDEGTAHSMSDETLLKASEARISRTREFDQSSTFLPHRDYRCGDHVLYQTGGTFESMRVFSLSLTVGERLSGYVVLGDRFEDALITAARATNSLVIGKSTTGNGSQPGNLNDYRTPVAATGLLGSSDAYIDQHGDSQGSVALSWTHPGKATDGTAQTMDRFEFQYRPHDGAWEGFASVPGGERALYKSPVRNERADGSPETYDFRVRAVGANYRVSAWSSPYRLLMETDTTPPPVPEFLPENLTTWLRTVAVVATGKGSLGEAMPPDFSHFNAYRLTSLTGFPGVLLDSKYGPEPGLVYQSTSMPLATAWFYLTSVDRSGNESEPSAVQSITPTSNVDVSEIADTLDAAAVQISNADKILTESGIELGQKLAESDAELSDHDDRLTADAGRLNDAFGKIGDVETSLGDLAGVQGRQVTHGSAPPHGVTPGKSLWVTPSGHTYISQECSA